MTDDSAPRPITNHAAMAGASRTNQQPFPGPTLTSRLLLLRPDDGPAAGAVDGAGWSRTANLTTELHDLISALTPRLGRIARTGFAWNNLGRGQRRIDDSDGVDVHDPAPDQPPDTMELSVTEGANLTLLIIPADTGPFVAAQRMRDASGGLSTIESRPIVPYHPSTRGTRAP